MAGNLKSILADMKIGCNDHQPKEIVRMLHDQKRTDIIAIINSRNLWQELKKTANKAGRH